MWVGDGRIVWVVGAGSSKYAVLETSRSFLRCYMIICL